MNIKKILLTSLLSIHTLIAMASSNFFLNSDGYFHVKFDNKSETITHSYNSPDYACNQGSIISGYKETLNKEKTNVIAYIAPTTSSDVCTIGYIGGDVDTKNYRACIVYINKKPNLGTYYEISATGCTIDSADPKKGTINIVIDP